MYPQTLKKRSEVPGWWSTFKLWTPKPVRMARYRGKLQALEKELSGFLQDSTQLTRERRAEVRARLLKVQLHIRYLESRGTHSDTQTLQRTMRGAEDLIRDIRSELG